MSPILIFAIITITLALIAYSFGVISEYRSKNLQWKHVAFFAAGLIFDFTGTALMSSLADSGESLMSPLGSTLMAISGTTALSLMVIHIIIAVVLLVKNQGRESFHKISMVIWIVWLISYLLGPIGMMV